MSQNHFQCLKPEVIEHKFNVQTELSCPILKKKKMQICVIKQFNLSHLPIL